eukprot:8324870-Lingulodinium_polyedra.AAC.1
MPRAATSEDLNEANPFSVFGSPMKVPPPHAAGARPQERKASGVSPAKSVAQETPVRPAAQRSASSGKSKKNKAAQDGTAASSKVRGRPKADLGITVQMHVESFRQATEESAIFFGADKVNYMRRLARTLKECQDACSAADEACSMETEDDMAHQRFEACQLQLKKMEVIVTCVKAAQTSGLHSPKFADAMRAEMHRMSLQPVVREDTLFPPCMRILYLKHELGMLEPDKFWQRLGEFKDIGLTQDEARAQQVQALSDGVARFVTGVGDAAAFEQWLPLEPGIYKSTLPAQLAAEMHALAVILHSEEVSDPEVINGALQRLSDVDDGPLHTLAIYPVGRHIVDRARGRTWL